MEPVVDTPNEPVAVISTTEGLYKDAAEALKAVRDDYLYWTGRLTETSLQLSYAVIAANWAVFGSFDGILASWWSKLSVVLVVFSLGWSVASARWMGELHRERIEYAEADRQRWKSQFSETAGKVDPWPFTSKIEEHGRWTRNAKTRLPLGAGAAFVIALLSR